MQKLSKTEVTWKEMLNPCWYVGKSFCSYAQLKQILYHHLQRIIKRLLYHRLNLSYVIILKGWRRIHYSHNLISIVQLTHISHDLNLCVISAYLVQEFSYKCYIVQELCCYFLRLEKSAFENIRPGKERLSSKLIAAFVSSE